MSEERVTSRVRPLEPETDLAALAELLNAIRQAEGNEATVTADALRPQLAQPKFRRWVAIDQGGEELIGLAVLFHQTPERCYGDVRVHPVWRRRGVGRLLADALVAGAAEEGAHFLAIDVAADNRDALRFLLSQGFRFRGDTWALMLPAAVELPAPVWPEGYTALPYAEVNDLPLYTDLCNQSFHDLWGHWENTLGLVDEAHMAETLAQFDPQGIFLVFDAAGAAVAHCRTMVSEDADAPHILDQPGVVASRRADGLHVPLALTAAHWLRQQGARPIRLESWGDAAATIALYEALGFAQAEHEVSYVREVGR